VVALSSVTRKILLLITDLEIGGTPTVVRELAIRLNEIPDVSIEVACLSQWGPVASELKSAGVTVHALAATSVRDLAVIARLISLIRRRSYDTVFSFLIHANFAAAVASKFATFRLIESIQTTQPRPRWHWWLQRRVRNAADKIVVPSASAAEVAKGRANVPSEKVVVIPNAINVEDFSRESRPDDHETPIPIGFIGRLDPVKRVPVLVRSLLHIKEKVHLHIFGEGRERTEIAAAIRSHGLDRRVTLHGVVARPQDALQQIRLLVLPSIAEGFGLVLIEAMAAGVPVIATNVPGIRDVVRDGETGLLVPPDDEVALAAAIDRVLGDANLRKKLIANAEAHVRQNFTWEQVLPKYRELLGLMGETA
jgi:glycosyltransferase involved in cell wall biosynthesis